VAAVTFRELKKRMKLLFDFVQEFLSLAKRFFRIQVLPFVAAAALPPKAARSPDN
jgi:hypothetical protein